MTRHRLDPLSLVVGAVCVALAVAVLANPDQLRVEDLRIAGPVVLLVVGLAALVSATGRRPRPDDGRALAPDADGPVPAEEVAAPPDDASDHAPDDVRDDEPRP